MGVVKNFCWCFFEKKMFWEREGEGCLERVLERCFEFVFEVFFVRCFVLKQFEWNWISHSNMFLCGRRKLHHPKRGRNKQHTKEGEEGTLKRRRQQHHQKRREGWRRESSTTQKGANFIRAHEVRPNDKCFMASRGAHCRQTHALTHVTFPIVKAITVQSISQKNKHLKKKP